MVLEWAQWESDHNTKSAHYIAYLLMLSYLWSNTSQRLVCTSYLTWTTSACIINLQSYTAASFSYTSFSPLTIWAYHLSLVGCARYLQLLIRSITYRTTKVYTKKHYCVHCDGQIDSQTDKEIHRLIYLTWEVIGTMYYVLLSIMYNPWNCDRYYVVGSFPGIGRLMNESHSRWFLFLICNYTTS